MSKELEKNHLPRDCKHCLHFQIGVGKKTVGYCTRNKDFVRKDYACVGYTVPRELLAEKFDDLEMDYRLLRQDMKACLSAFEDMQNRKFSKQTYHTLASMMIEKLKRRLYV